MKNIGQVSSLVISLLVLSGSIWGITHRQAILDYFALRNYSPDQQIVSLADRTTMQDDTRRIFYVNHPELNDKVNFRTNCPSTEASIVLGCYIENKGIFLLKVTDERLAGVTEVTAAHEALHAEYDRLSKSERERVDTMTSEAYSNVTNERIKKTVEQYRTKDASIVPNELHSIIATEVRDLPAELESYYSQYFKDRKAVVAFSEMYEKTFVSLTTQVEEYDSQLSAIKAEIDSNQVEIEGMDSEIEQQKQQLDAWVESDRTAEYNNAVPGYNARVNAYNALINRTRNLIAQYNDIVSKRNDIATTEKELVEAINSNSLPEAAE
jgi:ACT domain-containing protein